MRSRIARTSAWNRQQCATISAAPDAREAAIIASHSATDVAIGFSTSTCFPASSAATVCGACRAFGVPTTTASTSGSVANAAPIGRDAADPVSFGERAGRLLPVVRHRDDLVRRDSTTARAWKSWIQPQPNSATLMAPDTVTP